MYLFNSRRNNFIDVSISSGIDDPNKGRGAVYADLNNDGLLDIIVNNVRIKEDNNGHAQVYLNQGKSNGGFIKIKLEGVQSNRSAIGAQVELYADGRMLKREVTGGSSYLSNHSYVVHFGTGSLTIDSLVIRWPSGNRQLFNQIENNAFYYVRENENMQLYEYGTTTSTIEHIVYDFNVYPNPATNQLNITRIGETLDPVSITLQTLDGKPVNYTNLLTAVPNRPHELQIDISSLSAGLYFLCIREKEKTYCKKILVVD